MSRTARLLLCIVIVVLSILTAFASEPAGRWEGAIEVPNSPIQIVVELQLGDGGEWLGEIDILSQGLKDFALERIEVDGTDVQFAIPGVPGNPHFTGTLAEDGTLAGSFQQAGQTIPFALNRAGNAQIEAKAAPVALTPEQAQTLTARWEGILEVPGNPLTVAFVLTTDEDGSLTGTFDSPDQGRTGMPISTASVDGDTLRVALVYAGVEFEGELNAARTKWVGAWKQGGGSLPLTLAKIGTSSEHFPQSSPQSVGISPEAVELISRQVEALVSSEQIVGGELLIVKDRKSVYREAFGWKDKESKQALEPDAVYCVRSMTKPFVGTAIQMLLDEQRLRLSTPVYEILPAFDTPATRPITIAHLLTHTAGFPFTTITRGLDNYADLAAIAAEAATTELLFKPGERFEYSDASSDTLGAIVAKITGQPVEAFIQSRILEPLGMTESYPLLAGLDDVKQRIPTAYSGGTGSWGPHWRPTEDPTMFPIFLTSQSLYSTTTDYARFLEFWMDGGRVGDQRLLTEAAHSRALTPRNRLEGYPPSFADAAPYYGQQWIVYAAQEGEQAGPMALFGHDGSDGTHAWAWPEQDLIVLFFTQSRGTLAGLDLAAKLQKILIEKDLDHPSLTIHSAEAAELEPLAGIYWDNDSDDRYSVVSVKGERLLFSRPGRANLSFKPSETPGRFVYEASDRVAIEFERDENNVVTALNILQGDRTERHPAYVPPAGLPSAKEVAELLQRAHHMDRLPQAGIVKLTGTLKRPAQNLEGQYTVLFDSTRNRSKFVTDTMEEGVLILDDQAWTLSKTNGVNELTGRMLEQSLLEQWRAQFGDWRDFYESVSVLRRIEVDGKPVLMVRVEPKHGQGSTQFVDETSGTLLRSENLLQLPGLGILGVRSEFSDYREVGGMLLPFHVRTIFESRLIGAMTTTIESAEVGIKETETMFDLPDSSE